MPPFANPCSDFVTPYLQQQSSEWKHACKLVLLSRVWQAAIREWRALVTEIVLERIDSNGLLAVQKHCPRLTSLTLMDCNVDAAILAMRLNEIAASCAHVTQLRLECTRFRLTPDFFHQDWADAWSNLTLFEFSATVAIRLDSEDIAAWTARFKTLQTIIISNAVWFVKKRQLTCRLIASFIEQQKSTLNTLKLSKNIFPSVFVADKEDFRIITLPFYYAVAACDRLKELHLPGLSSYLDDDSLKIIVRACKDLRVLDLSETSVSVAALQELAALPVIESLCIHRTPLAKEMTERCRRGLDSDIHAVWPELMRTLHQPWGVLEFQRSNPNDPNIKWLGPTNTDGNLAVQIYGYDFSVGRSRSNILQIGGNWCVLLFPTTLRLSTTRARVVAGKPFLCLHDI